MTLDRWIVGLRACLAGYATYTGPRSMVRLAKVPAHLLCPVAMWVPVLACGRLNAIYDASQAPACGACHYASIAGCI